MPPGASTLTVTATAPDGATAFAQTTVIFDVVPGTLLFAASDPDGDDNGPGTYDYPNSDDFVDGAYDLQAFEVYDSGPDTVTFRVQTRDLTPTFGSPLGAQLIDVYLRDPAATTTSTAASFPQRNYTIDPAAAWSRLIEVQGFGQRFIDASGATVGTVAIRGTQVTRWITFTVTKAALGGTPGTGLVVRRGPHRPGRVQPRPGPRVPAAVARTSSSVSARPRQSRPATRSARSIRAPSPRRWTSSRRTGRRRRTSSTRWPHRSSSRR